MEENKTFRVLSGLGIILVVCGHAQCGWLDFGGYLDYDAFHMPLFIFISGYFFRSSNIEHIGKTIRHKFRTLVVPFVFWNIVYYFIFVIFFRGRILYLEYQGPLQLNADYFKQLFFGIGNASYFCSPAWFLINLFYCEMLYILLRKIMVKVKIDIWWFRCLCMLGMSFLGVTMCRNNLLGDYSLVVGRIMYGLLYYEAGTTMCELNKLVKHVKRLQEALLVFAILSVVFINLKVQTRIVVPYIYGMFYWNYAIIIMQAFSGIIIWYSIAYFLEPVLYKIKNFYYIATHTKEIMLHHLFIYKCWMILILWILK